MTKRILRVIGFFIFLIANNIISQTTTGPNSPSAAADGGSGGGGTPSWSTASGNPFSSNNTYVSITSQNKSKATNYLHVTGFGFAIPVGSYITGITVEVEMYGTVPGGATNVETSILLINSSGSRVGTNHSTGATLATADPNSYVTYGSTTDNWGGVLTYADINSANFGVALQYTTGSVNNTAGNYNFYVDHVRVSVTYVPNYDAVANGCFNDGATWGRVSPGTAGIDYPDATIAASIPGGRTVTICSGSTANCYSLMLNSDLSASSGATLTLADATATLNVVQDLEMKTSTSASASFASGTINITGGTINVFDDLTMTADKNGGNVTTQSIVFGGGTLTVDGDVTLDDDHSSATTTLNMTAANSVFNLGGTLTFDAGSSLTNGTGATGTVNYKGSSGQTVLSAITYYNLTTSGGGLKTLNGNTTVKGTFTMSNGNINMGANTLTLGASTAAPGSLAWVSGTLYNGTFLRWFNTSTIADNLTSGSGLFPVGTSSNYRPFYVYFPTTGPSTGGTLSVSHTDPGTGPTTVSFTDGSGNTVVRRTDMGWVLTAANSFNIAVNNLNVRISGTNFGTIGNINDVRVVRSGSVIGSNGTNAGTTSNPIVKRTSLPAFTASSNTFYIGSINATNSPLPIELLAFEAKSDYKAINLLWTTATETNNDYFTIEKTKDAINFETVAIVDGAGNSTSVLNYRAVDNAPYEGVSYYRLKQTDFNGNYDYSQLVSVEYNPSDKDFSFNVYPNPANGENINLSIDSGAQGEEVLVIVYDLTGRESYSKVVITESSSNYVCAIDTANKLSPGVYMITATSKQSIYSKKLVVK